MKANKLLVLSSFLVLGLTACTVPSLIDNGVVQDSSTNEVKLLAKDYALSSTYGVYLFANDSGQAKLLREGEGSTEDSTSEDSNSGDVSADPDNPSTDEGDTSTEDEEELALVDKYLALYNSFTSENALKIEALASDKAEYAYLNVITIQDILGNTYTYSVYFNEKVEDEEIDEDSDEPTEDEESEDNEGEIGDADSEDGVEISDPEEDSTSKSRKGDGGEEHHKVHSKYTVTEISGLLVSGENQYPLTGKRGVREDGEKVRLSLLAQVSETSYIRVRNSVSDSRQSFAYSLYENEELVNRTWLRTTNEEGFANVSLMSVSSEGFSRYSFTTISDEEGTFIRISFDDPTDGVGVIYIWQSTDEEGNPILVYMFEDGSYFHGHGHGHSHGDGHGHDHGEIPGSEDDTSNDFGGHHR